jgi:fluoroquinolone transport system permease protein
MKRLTSTLQLDATVQVRNKLYHISIGLVFLLVVMLRQLFPHEAMGQVMPAWFLGAIAPTTYFFVAGLLLFDKGERTLDVLTITPLRTHEYLSSKLVTLTALAMTESLLTVVLAYGFGFNLPLLLAGIAAMGAIYTLFGLIVVVRYASISDFLMPSIMYNAVLELPFLHYFGIWETPLFYLWPTQPPLLLMKAAFVPVPTWQIIYGLAGSAVVIGLVYWWSYRAFEHFIIRQERSA